jgi:hypothetical protein
MSDGIHDGQRGTGIGRVRAERVPEASPVDQVAGWGLEWMQDDNWVLICTGEGAASVVFRGVNLVGELHRFMCCCGKDLGLCGDVNVLEILDQMRTPDNWNHDEQGKLFQFSHEFEISDLAITRVDVIKGCGSSDL